jgi:hypothetical protein
VNQTDSNPKINSVGGLALAGLSGGPLAILLLTYFDLKVIGRSNEFRRVLIWFTPLIALWICMVLVVPPDLLSQLIPFIPQVFLWWVVVRRLLSNTHNQYQSDGGLFRSKWRSVWFGFLVFAALRIAVFTLGWGLN